MKEEKHRRRSIRLPGYDYSQGGWYFVTICVQDRECLFGHIEKGQMILNQLGEIVRDEWLKTPIIRPNVLLDEFAVLPNHWHGIIAITDNDCNDCRGEALPRPQNGATHRVECRGEALPRPQNGATHRVAPTSLTANSLGSIIGQCKSITAKRINQLRNTPGYPVWQRNYYEHIIRNEKSYWAIREYIQNNPVNWANDDENPLKNMK